MNKLNVDLKKVLEFLVKDKIIPLDVIPEYESRIESEKLISVINKGCDLIYDSNSDELFAKDVDGSIINCPDLSEGLSVSSKWISDYIPDVFFDTEQGGNLRKADEADCCFKLFSIGLVLKDYREEVIDLFKNYDYEEMSNNRNGDSYTFRSALQKFQDLSSSRINSVISAAAYKLSIFKEKNESYYTGQLSQEEISGLSALSRSIRAVISKYEREDGLNPKEMASMRKITRLETIERRDLEIEALIVNSEYAMLYRISKLNSERIPPVIKSKILKEADKASTRFVAENKLSGFKALDAEKEVRRIVQREGYRAVLKTIKAEDIKKYKSDPTNFLFKAKS